MVAMQLARLCLFASAGLHLLDASASPAVVDVEAIHERLEALDAERNALHHRLAMAEGGRKEQHATLSGDGLAEVLERLALDLAPLLPELALELMMLACAGVLLYAVTAFRAQSGFAQSQTKHFEASSAPVSATCTRGCSIDNTQRCNSITSPTCDVNESERDRSTSLTCPTGNSMDHTQQCNLPPSTSHVANKSESDRSISLIGPPPGLSLNLDDECVLVPPIELLSETEATILDATDQDAVIDAASGRLHSEALGVELELEPPASPELEHSIQTSEAHGAKVELADLDEEQLPAGSLVGVPHTNERNVPGKSAKGAKSQKRSVREVSKKSKSEAPTKDVVDEDFDVTFDIPAAKKRTDPQCSEKNNKKKGKQLQQHKTANPKQVRDNRLSSNRPKWPCSLPFTVAILIMFSVILLGQIASKADIAHEALAEKKQQLEELQAKKKGLQRKMALMELEQFAANAQHAINTVPAVHTKKLEDMKADAEKLNEALQEVPDADFPQVEESFKTVLAGWKRSLNDINRLASLSPEEKESQCRSTGLKL
mmetsp:Transcript_36714/g.58750  ORF Transcript_36714/g.58750 Transcript_36714/m.58750 type:complete len:544 (-) Transcript_36714:89-1720(-)